MRKNCSLHDFAVQSKYEQKYLFPHICFPNQMCAKLRVYASLLSSAKLRKNCRLQAFAIVRKSALKYLFAHLCYPNETWTKLRVCTPTLSSAKPHKISVCTPLLHLANKCKDTSLHAIASHSKYVQTYFFACFCVPK